MTAGEGGGGQREEKGGKVAGRGSLRKMARMLGDDAFLSFLLFFFSFVL